MVNNAGNHIEAGSGQELHIPTHFFVYILLKKG